MAQPVAPFDQQAIVSAIKVLLNGELSQFNRMAGGAIANTLAAFAVSTLVKTGSCLFYGVYVTVTGTTPTIIVYDNTSAAGEIKLNPPTASIVAGTFLGFGGGLGITMNNGIYVALGGGVNCTCYPIFV